MGILQKNIRYKPALHGLPSVTGLWGPQFGDARGVLEGCQVILLRGRPAKPSIL